jgi:hypothetical protein
MDTIRECGILYNEELHAMWYYSLNILRAIMSSRMQWAERVV